MIDLGKIDFLIFDLGNVIIDIDYDVSINELKKVIPSNKHHLTAEFFPSAFHKAYEKGIIDSATFREEIRSLYAEDIEDAKIDHIWNALLGEIPQERLNLIQKLRQSFGTAILSNTNEIHINKFNEILTYNSDLNHISEICEWTFLSNEMGMAKPDREIYLSVLDQINIEPGKVLFFDDLAANIEGAKSVGIHGYQITHPKALLEFFSHV